MILIIYSLFGFHFITNPRPCLAAGYREKPPDTATAGYCRKLPPHDEGLCMEREANNQGEVNYSRPPPLQQSKG